MSKRKTPPEVGYRASEEFTRYARENGLTFEQASERAGFDRKLTWEWWTGQSPSSASLVGLASIGIDVGYIITGNRTPKVVHAHWEIGEDGNPECSECGAVAPIDKFELDTRDKIRYEKTPHCPYCGAIMDEED